ncbi:MAG: FG-GAP repeat protein [Ferruginibacter sp.]
MKKTFLFLNLFLVSPFFLFAQNIGIGTTSPNASAALEIQSTSKGMLVPRIALSAANIASPVTSPADALLLYNTATAGLGSDAVTPGFYYWNAAATRWISINKTSDNNGNAGFGTWGDCSVTNVSEYNPVAANDGATGDRMGAGVAISGSYAFVGAPSVDIGGNIDQGAVYVFYFNGINWVQQQKLTASDGASSDNFGISVAMSGNYAVVGSYGDDIGANVNQGSIYIFFYNGSSWVQQQKLIAADGAANDLFGNTTSISGNYIVAGALFDDVGANTDQGSAYIFNFNGSTWVQQQKLTASDGASNDFFGAATVSGNYLVVGAYGSDIAGSVDQGAAYVFNYTGSTWAQQQKITASDGINGDGLGTFTSISGDYLIVGSYNSGISGNAAQGAAYIFHRNGSFWGQEQKLFALDGAAGDNFGGYVFLSGDYAIISAYGDDIGTNVNQGSVYIFQNFNGIWQLLQKITNPAGGASDLFGVSCTLSGKRFAVGAWGTANNRGIAFFGKIN